MHRLAWLSFVFCIALAASYIVATADSLPARVASHFGAGNDANAFMTRDGYVAFMLAFAVVLPGFVAAMIGLLPRKCVKSINLPHRQYWLDPARREATLNALSAHGAWYGCLMAIFVAGIHHVVLVANRSTPPQLPDDLFWILVVGFVAGTALWAAALWLRFRNAS